MIAKESDEIDLAQLIRTLWLGKYLISLIALVALLVGIWVAYFQSVPVFTSHATVALESREEKVVDIESVVTGLAGDQVTINTQIEVIRSRGLIEKLVLKLNLVEDPEFNFTLRKRPTLTVGALVRLVQSTFTSSEPRRIPTSERSTLDAVIDAVLNDISVTNIRQSYVFRISVTTQQPEKSAAMANALSELYILSQLESKFEATEQATTWLTDRVADLQVQLETAETEVKEFNARATLVSPEALAGLNRQIKDLRDRLEETNTNQAMFASRLMELKEARETDDLVQIVAIADDQTLRRVLQLMQNSGQDDPDRSAFDVRLEQIVTRAELEVTRATQRIAALEQSIADQEEQIGSQSADLGKLQQLQREAEASRLIYEFFLSRLKETSVQEGIQQADSRMLSKAVVPLFPSAPRKPLILIISLALGTVLGGGIVLIREYSQNTFRDVLDLENRTGYTVIGQVPVIAARRRKNVLRYLTDKPTSAAAEAIRNLRTSILLSNLDNPPQVIMSTSSVPQEGKTTQSLALTQNLTGLGKRVLLVEGDIRRRVFNQYFDIPEQFGLLSVLSGDQSLAEATVAVPELGADVLVGEKTKTNAADIFSSGRFAAFLEEARRTYDYVIIDTPPVLAVPDARIVGQSVDAIVYTVKWDSTSYRQVREGLKSLEDVNIKISGLVLSQINARQMQRYGYGDSYGAYSAYYDN